MRIASSMILAAALAAPAFAQVDTNLGSLGGGTYSLTGTTVGATNNIDTYSNGNAAAIWDQDVIFQFTTTSAFNIAFTSNDPDTNPDNDFFLLNSLATTINANGLRSATALGAQAFISGSFGLQPAGTYFFVVDAWRGNPATAGTPATGRAGAFAVNLSLSAPPPPPAAFYAGSLATSDSTFARPTTGTPPTTISTTATSVFYDIQPFFVTAAGSYTFEQTSAFDDFMVLYSGAFNPALPLLNAIDADDDDGVGNDSLITRNLLPGVQYFLVNTSFGNGATGNYTVSVINSANGVAVLGIVPEPATLGALAAFSLVALRRRK